MKLRIAGVLGGMLLSGCAVVEDTQIERAWIRLPAVEGRPAAAYFDLRTSSKPEVLLAASTPVAIRSELHESMKMDGGVMTMKPLSQVNVPPHGTLSFMPGGKHVMLYDVSPSLKAGGTAKLLLKFADGRTLETEAKVLGAGDAPPSAERRP